MARENASEQIERLMRENNLLRVRFNLMIKKSKLTTDEVEEVKREAEDLTK